VYFVCQLLCNNVCAADVFLLMSKSQNNPLTTFSMNKQAGHTPGYAPLVAVCRRSASFEALSAKIRKKTKPFTLLLNN